MYPKINEIILTKVQNFIDGTENDIKNIIKIINNQYSKSLRNPFSNPLIKKSLVSPNVKTISTKSIKIHNNNNNNNSNNNISNNNSGNNSCSNIIYRRIKKHFNVSDNKNNQSENKKHQSDNKNQLSDNNNTESSEDKITSNSNSKIKTIYYRKQNNINNINSFNQIKYYKKYNILHKLLTNSEKLGKNRCVSSRILTKNGFINKEKLKNEMIQTSKISLKNKLIYGFGKNKTNNLLHESYILYEGNNNNNLIDFNTIRSSNNKNNTEKINSSKYLNFLRKKEGKLFKKKFNFKTLKYNPNYLNKKQRDSNRSSFIDKKIFLNINKYKDKEEKFLINKNNIYKSNRYRNHSIKLFTLLSLAKK